MMKKLLIFILVLGMASAANAGLQISVHYDPPGDEPWDPDNPLDSEIVVAPSTYLSLDIYATGGDTGMDWPPEWFGFGGFALVCDVSLGTIDGTTGVTNIPPAPDGSLLYPGSATAAGVVGLPVGHDGIAGTVGSYTAVPPYPDGTYFDGIIFHCEGLGDVEILLMEFDPFTAELTGVIYDSVIVHQIPEPMTVLLLGFGALLLRRRR